MVLGVLERPWTGCGIFFAPYVFRPAESMVMVTVIATLLHGEIELTAVPLKVERTLHRIMIKMASFYLKKITHYLTLTTRTPSAPDDSSFLSQRLGITIFFTLPWLPVSLRLPVWRNWYSVVTEA